MIKIIRFPRYSFNSHFIAKRKYSYFGLTKKLNTIKYNTIQPSTVHHRVTIDTSCLVVNYQKNNCCNIRMSSGTSTSSDFIKLTDYDSIGFDLDNTLVRYNVKHMMELEYRVLATYLVNEKGYSSDLLYQPIDDDFDIVQKGLILDFQRGNILRLAENGYIQKAAHGSKMLSDAEIIIYYGVDRLWNPTTQFCEEFLSAWNGPLSECFRTLLDYFDMPVALIFTRIIDTVDQNDNNVTEYNVWPDIHEGLITMFARENFLSPKSEYFLEMRRTPEKYILKSSEKLVDWLKELKKVKPIFLLTGSHIDFADLTASHALGKNWRDLFDVIVCYAKKPGFFFNNRPFYSLNGYTEGSIITRDDLKLNGIYSQGNWNDLIYLLNQKSKTNSNNILYMGDNLIQDVYTPQKYEGIDTVAICEEMETIDSIAEHLYHKQYDTLKSKFWGSYFNNDNGDSTVWSTLIKAYSKICVPNVDVLAQHPINHSFKCFKNTKNSNEGFHPFELSKIKNT